MTQTKTPTLQKSPKHKSPHKKSFGMGKVLNSKILRYQIKSSRDRDSRLKFSETRIPYHKSWSSITHEKGRTNITNWWDESSNGQFLSYETILPVGVSEYWIIDSYFEGDAI